MHFPGSSLSPAFFVPTDQTQQLAERTEAEIQAFVAKVGDHLQDVMFIDGIENMGIQEIFSPVDESKILNDLYELQKNSSSPEHLEEGLRKINKTCFSHFRKKEFRSVVETLGSMAIPIIEKKLKEQIPVWKTIKDEISIGDELKTVEIIKNLHLNGFPCHGVGMLLYMRGMITFRDTSVENFMPEKALIYEALQQVDPTSYLAELGLALCYRPLIGNPDTYARVKSIFEKVIANGSSECKDIAYEQLADLLEKGTVAYPSDPAQAKHILQRAISDVRDLKMLPRSCVALKKLLIQEGTSESLTTAIEIDRLQFERPLPNQDGDDKSGAVDDEPTWTLRNPYNREREQPDGEQKSLGILRLNPNTPNGRGGKMGRVVHFDAS